MFFIKKKNFLNIVPTCSGVENSNVWPVRNLVKLHIFTAFFTVMVYLYKKPKENNMTRGLKIKEKLRITLVLIVEIRQYFPITLTKERGVGTFWI